MVSNVMQRLFLLFLVGSSFVTAISVIIYAILYRYRQSQKQKQKGQNIPGPIPSIFLILFIYGISALAYYPIIFGKSNENWSILIGLITGVVLAILAQPLGLHTVFFGEYAPLYYVFAPLACMLISRFYVLYILSALRQGIQGIQGIQGSRT